ncbi:transposase [Candidatus Dependentiae bacterium]|nr:transposase [Candidatus Dependentiae bacterium]
MITCGVDPSRQGFAVSFVKNMHEFEYLKYKNSPAGIRDFIKKIKKIKPMPSICIEGHGDQAKMLALYLNKNSFSLYEINPLKSRRFKESITDNKTDHIDAYSSAMFPFFRDDLNELSINMKIEGLKNMTRSSEKIGKMVVQMKNRLHAALNQNFGLLYKELFSKFNQTSLNFYINFSSLNEISNATVSQIHKVFKLGDSTKYKGNFGKNKAKEIKEFVKNTYFFELNDFTKLQGEVIKSIAEILLKIIKSHDRIKKAIKDYVTKMFPGFSYYLEDLKGVKELTFGKLISEIKDIDSFSNEGKLASYAGQAPKIYQSASIKKMRVSKNYNRHLSHTIHLITCTNIQKTGIFHNLYEKNKKCYKSKLGAMKPIKRKIVRRLYYILKEYFNDLKNDSLKTG